MNSLYNTPFPVPKTSDWTIEANSILLTNYIYPSIKSSKFKNNIDNLAQCTLKNFTSKFNDYKAFYDNPPLNIGGEIIKMLYLCITKVNVLPIPDNTDWNDVNKSELVNFIAFYSYFGNKGVYLPEIINNCVLPELVKNYTYSKLYIKISYQDKTLYTIIDSLLSKCANKTLMDINTQDNSININLILGGIVGVNIIILIIILFKIYG
jgi:hypothetical protein